MEMLESYYVDDISESLCMRVCSLVVAVLMARFVTSEMIIIICSNSTSCTAWRMQTSLSPVPIRTYYLVQVQIILCDDDEYSARLMNKRKENRCVTGETRTILFSISELFLPKMVGTIHIPRIMRTILSLSLSLSLFPSRPFPLASAAAESHWLSHSCRQQPNIRLFDCISSR